MQQAERGEAGADGIEESVPAKLNAMIALARRAR
jgi:hypothetical protein